MPRGTISNLKRPVKGGPSPNPKGRPKNIDKILQEYFFAERNLKLSKGQTQEIIQSLLSRPSSELMELAKHPDLPFWISLIAKKAKRDFDRGSIHVLEVLFDRVYGKPKEEVTQLILERPIFNGIDIDVSENDSAEENNPT
jgi:hypothetical protein